MLLVITMWVRDRINNLHLGRKTIGKGTQSTKISVLIGTDHKISTTDFDSALSMELVTLWKAAGTAIAGRLCVCTDMYSAGTCCAGPRLQRSSSVHNRYLLKRNHRAEGLFLLQSWSTHPHKPALGYA